MFCVLIFTLGCVGLSKASEKLLFRKDEVLSPEGIILKKFVFTNATKHWNNYIIKLIQYSTEKIFSTNILRKESSIHYLPHGKSVKNSIQFLFEHVNEFLFKSKQVNNCSVNPYKFSPFYMETFHEIHEITLFKPLMTYRPSNLQMNRFLSDLIDDIQVKQHFVLNPNLHLNISFHYIYFSSNSFLKCLFGSLTIDLHSVGLTYGNIPYYIKSKYCGIVPSFTHYLTPNRITIAIIIESYQVTFDTTISYSVIDAYKITSYHVDRTNSEVPIRMIKPLNTKSYLLKYQFKVQRYEIMNILCNISQYNFIKVYDGPGILYNILNYLVTKSELVLYTTTTFQCVLYLFTKWFNIKQLNFIAYDGTKSTKTQWKIYLPTNNSKCLTPEMYLSLTDVSLIKIETEGKQFLKIAIHQMKYTGIKYSSCLYAGITSYDKKGNGTFQKISTICYSDEQEYRYRNIYTENSVMLLVLYSYKKYSNISFNLSVSATECKATTINICELEHDPLSLESNSLFSAKEHQCIILQLDYKQGNTSLLEMDKGTAFIVGASLFHGTNFRRKYKEQNLQSN